MFLYCLQRREEQSILVSHPRFGGWSTRQIPSRDTIGKSVKSLKIKGIFPSDTALEKLTYLYTNPSQIDDAHYKLGTDRTATRNPIQWSVFYHVNMEKIQKIALNLRNDFGIANDPKIAPKNYWHILIYAPLLYISLLPKVCLAGVFMFTKLVKTRNLLWKPKDFVIFVSNKGYLTRWLRNVANFAHSPNRYQNPCKIFLKSCLSDWDICQLIA